MSLNNNTNNYTITTTQPTTTTRYYYPVLTLSITDLRALFLKTRISEESKPQPPLINPLMNPVESAFAPPPALNSARFVVPTSSTSAGYTSYANSGAIGLSSTSLASTGLSSVPSTSLVTPSVSVTSSASFAPSSYGLGATSIASSSTSSSTAAAPKMSSPPVTDSATDDEHNHLSLMHQKLAESFMASSNASSTSSSMIPRGRTGSPTRPGVWVAKWVDYSNKYGLGYLLSNGVCGAYFNDSTKMVSANQKYVVGLLVLVVL